MLALFNKIEISTKLGYISGYINCTKKADHILEMRILWLLFQAS